MAGIYERAQFHADPNKNLYPADLEYALIQGGFFKKKKRCCLVTNRISD